RRDLIKVVTEIGALPVTMDAFDISDKNEQRLIRKAVEECDYFLNLTAHKCGTLLGSSFAAEAELTWAEKRGIPVLALVIDEKARWKAAKKEKSPELVKALEGFKKRLLGHSSETWTSQADLRQKAQGLLIQAMNLNPRRGWVPGSEAIDPSVANELSRLILENENLKNQLRMEGGTLVSRVREQMKQALKVLAVNKLSLSFWYAPGDNWENTTQFRYLRLFRLLSPELSLAKTTSDISRFLGNILNPDLNKTVRKDYPVPTNTIKKLMADLALLKLVKRSGSGDDDAWEMTEYGKEAYAAYRLRHLERALEKQKKS
ncbi:MAG: DUF4062 domain-containing protein, partial [Treponema sp.]|nr:DUF4062 domain-containing protein [Treponema sp.]